MQLKDTYQEKLETQLKEWNAKIGELRSRAERVATGARVKYQEEVEALRFRYEGAQRKLQELKQAGEGVWEDLRSGIEGAWDELRQAVDNVVSRFKRDEGREEEIRLVAYRIWEEEGCPHGRDLEHWRKAEAIWEEQHREKPRATRHEKPTPKAKGKRRSSGARPKRSRS